jgi:hypothetical protein
MLSDTVVLGSDTGNESLRNGVSPDLKHDRDGPGDFRRRSRSGSSEGDDHVHRERNQLGALGCTASWRATPRRECPAAGSASAVAGSTRYLRGRPTRVPRACARWYRTPTSSCATSPEPADLERVTLDSRSAGGVGSLK